MHVVDRNIDVMFFKTIIDLLLFHSAIVVQGLSYYAILHGTNDNSALLNQITNVVKVPDCAKRCENEECKSFAYNQVQTLCRTYSTRHRLLSESTSDGYTYFQKSVEGESRLLRMAETFVFNNKSWTVIQKRFDGTLSFDRDWSDYKNGFGSPFGEYWIGLENMRQLIASSPHALLVILESWAGEVKYAQYDQFYLSPEADHYRLNISGYSGTAGNCLMDSSHNYMAFSTKDKDNDLTHNACAQSFSSGFWYSSCSACNINGPMKPFTGKNDRVAIIWVTFSNMFMPLRKTRMLMRKMT